MMMMMMMMVSLHSQRPIPLRQLLKVSLRARRVESEGTAPLRSAMALAAYRYWSADLYLRHFRAAPRARTTRAVNGKRVRPKHAKYFWIVRCFDLLGPLEVAAYASLVTSLRAWRRSEEDNKANFPRARGNR